MKNLKTLIILAALAAITPLLGSTNEGNFEPSHVDYRILLISNKEFQSITQQKVDSVNFRPDGRAKIAGKLFKELDEGKLEAHFEVKRELNESDPQPIEFSPANKPSLGSIQLLTINGEITASPLSFNSSIVEVMNGLRCTYRDKTDTRAYSHGVPVFPGGSFQLKEDFQSEVIRIAGNDDTSIVFLARLIENQRR